MLLVPALFACGGDDAGSLDDWCEVNERIYARGNLDDEVEAGDADQLRDAYAEMRALLDEAAKVAPEDILADANTVADAADRLDHVLEGADYDMAAIEADGIVDVAGIAAEREPAIERIEAFNARECGLEPPADDGDVAAESADETVGDPVDEVSEDAVSGDVSSDPDSEWCIAAREMETVADAMDDIDYTDPEAVETAVTEFVSKYEEIAPLAPAEIAGDIALNMEGALLLRDALAAVDYDFLVADLSAIGRIEAEADAAKDRIEAYNERACGIPADVEADTTDDATESEFDPFEGSIRDQVIAELVRSGFTEDEAACFFDNIDFTDPDAAGDTDAIMVMLDECGIDIARLMEIGEALSP